MIENFIINSEIKPDLTLIILEKQLKKYLPILPHKQAKAWLTVIISVQFYISRLVIHEINLLNKIQNYSYFQIFL